LPPQRCQALARETGFQKRAPRKISPTALLQALTLLAFYSRCSFDLLASLLGLLTTKPLSKQALAKRCTRACVDFVRRALLELSTSLVQLPPLRQSGALASFRRVLLHDSTSLALDPRLAKAFPGSKNQSHQAQAGAKIQAVYELLSQRFLHFELSAFTRNDQAAAPDLVPLLHPGDLVLRDLGYFVLRVFAQIQERGAYFLSRFRYGVQLYSPAGQPLNLLRLLRRTARLDRTLLLGAQEKLPVRLVAIPLPPAVAAERRRKAKLNRDRRCRPNRESLALLGWLILVTNIPQSTCSAKQLAQIYRLRWRIEILFKSWKSHFKLTQLPAGSPEQIEILLYSRLLFISLFQTTFGLLSRYFQYTHHRSLSLLRLARFLTEHHALLPALLRHPGGLSLLQALLLKHCTYDKRKNRSNFAENLSALS